MKISKRHLKRIIKEEKAKVLAEQKVRRIVRRKLLEQMDKKGHADLAQGSWYLDGNNVAMTDDDVARQFGGGPVPRDGVEAQLQSLNTLKAAGYHTVSEEDSDTPSQPIDQMIAFVQDAVDDNRSGGHTYVVEQRSGASNAGVIQGTGVKIFTSDNVANNPAAQEPNASVYPGTFNSAADMRNFANWLKDTHGVTHVQDNDLEFDLGMPEGGPGLAIDEWAEMQ